MRAEMLDSHGTALISQSLDAYGRAPAYKIEHPKHTTAAAERVTEAAPSQARHRKVYLRLTSF